MAELATAANRHERELERIKDHRLSIDILTRELTESEQRAALFATQAAEHKVVSDAYLVQWQQWRQERIATYRHRTETAPANPSAPIRGANSAHPNKSHRRKFP